MYCLYLQFSKNPFKQPIWKNNLTMQSTTSDSIASLIILANVQNVHCFFRFFMPLRRKRKIYSGEQFLRQVSLSTLSICRSSALNLYAYYNAISAFMTNLLCASHPSYANFIAKFFIVFRRTLNNEEKKHPIANWTNMAMMYVYRDVRKVQCNSVDAFFNVDTCWLLCLFLLPFFVLLQNGKKQ